MEGCSVGAVAILGVHLPELTKLWAGVDLMDEWGTKGRGGYEGRHKVRLGEVGPGDNEGYFESLSGRGGNKAPEERLKALGGFIH
jgi:hypothetical protein